MSDDRSAGAMIVPEGALLSGIGREDVGHRRAGSAIMPGGAA